jgi:hypothetical protein
VRLLRRGLDQTAALWPEVETGFAYLKRVARLLSNPEGLTGPEVRRRFRRLIGRMKAAARRAERRGQGKLTRALRHFVKVSGSYEPGLFPCYEVAGLERTNNALEQLFGSHRYHERRANGRKRGSPTTAVRGAVRLVAAAVTRLSQVGGMELAPKDVAEWQEQRARLQRHQDARTLQRRFRHDPQAYLRELEARFIQSPLPS